LKESPLLDNFLGLQQTTKRDEPRLESQPFSKPSLTDTTTEPIGMREFEGLTDFFIQTASSISKKSKVWLEGWQELCKGSIHLCKVPIFMRTIIPYSHMCAANMDIAKQMISYSLDFLAQQGAGAFIQTSSGNDFVLAVLLSINSFLKEIELSEGNELLEVVNKMYFMSVMMLIVADQRLMLSNIELLITILDVMYNCNCFEGYHSIGEHFNAKFRSMEALTQFEQLVGVSFKEHFSFAIVVLIMRALVDEKTRVPALALVKQFLIISNKLEFATINSIGFITALIPFERQYNSPLYCDYLFQAVHFVHPKGEISFLFHKTLFTIVSELTAESEKLAIYKTIQRGLETLKTQFVDVFKDYHSLTHVVKVYTSADDNVVEAALSLFKTMSNGMSSSAMNTKEPFEECNFKGFRSYTKFDKVSSEVTLKATKILVDYILKNFSTGIVLKVQPKKQPTSPVKTQSTEPSTPRK
jgi:hypothetical protein